MIKTVSCILSREVAGICSDKHHSVVRSKSIEVLSSFDCKEIIDELCSHAPTLLSAVISGIILKHRRPSCYLIQQVISLILYAGHSAKQVCNTIHVYSKYMNVGLHAATESWLILIAHCNNQFSGQSWRKL